MIQVDNLSFQYTQDLILDHLNFTLNKGDITVIIGNNGTGKTTFLKLLLGILKPDSGTISLFQKEITHLENYSKISYVPQGNIIHKVSFPLTCLEIVSMALYRDFGFFKIPRKKHKKIAEKNLIDMGLKEFINTPFNELSGGTQQRVLITRALTNQAKLLILDEPTAGIDEKSKEHLSKLLIDLNKKDNMTILLVTHELEWVRDSLKPHHIVELKKGSLEDVTV